MASDRECYPEEASVCMLETDIGEGKEPNMRRYRWSAVGQMAAELLRDRVYSVVKHGGAHRGRDFHGAGSGEGA